VLSVWWNDRAEDGSRSSRYVEEVGASRLLGSTSSRFISRPRRAAVCRSRQVDGSRCALSPCVHRLLSASASDGSSGRSGSVSGSEHTDRPHGLPLCCVLSRCKCGAALRCQKVTRATTTVRGRRLDAGCGHACLQGGPTTSAGFRPEAWPPGPGVNASSGGLSQHRDRCQNGGVAVVPKIPGHSIRVGPSTSGRRWLARCQCGYVSATRTSEALALGAAIHHLQKTARQLRVDGVSHQPIHRSA
jgi:hypothetical protein